MDDDLYERLLFDLKPADIYQMGERMAQELEAIGGIYAPFGRVIRAGIATLPLKDK